MIACVDVDYRADHAAAACLTFHQWEDAAPVSTIVARIDDVEDYVPGEFYKRELPCLLQVLEPIAADLTTVVVDGYTSLAPGKPGLGAHLYEALGREIPVVGVAKTRFAGATSEDVLRGTAIRPLYVTAIGMTVVDAAAFVKSMHGPYRIPTLLKLVDHVCRTASV